MLRSHLGWSFNAKQRQQRQCWDHFNRYLLYFNVPVPTEMSQWPWYGGWINRMGILPNLKYSDTVLLALLLPSFQLLSSVPPLALLMGPHMDRSMSVRAISPIAR